MTGIEWAQIVGFIAANWPGNPPPDDALDKWGRDLADLPAKQVYVGVEALALAGREFPPNGAQIRAEVVRLGLDLPDWDEAFGQLRRIRNAPKVSCKAIERDYEIDEEIEFVTAHPRAAVLSECHPLVAGFYEALGKQVDAAMGTESDGFDEARLRNKWTDFCERTTRDQLLGHLPDAGLRELKRLKRGSHRPVSAGEVFGRALRAIEPGQEAA